MNWNLDKAHSELVLKVKHMMISNVTGTFDDFDVVLESADTNFKNTNIEVIAQAASIQTRNEQRDEHLRSADFLETEKFPTLTFKAQGADLTSGTLKGELTIKGETREVEFDLEFGGVNKDPWGNQKAGFSVEGKISRKDFGLTWNAVLESGGVMVSDIIRVSADLQFVQEA